jgi:hypothetical protein
MALDMARLYCVYYVTYEPAHGSVERHTLACSCSGDWCSILSANLVTPNAATTADQSTCVHQQYAQHVLHMRVDTIAEYQYPEDTTLVLQTAVTPAGQHGGLDDCPRAGVKLIARWHTLLHTTGSNSRSDEIGIVWLDGEKEPSLVLKMLSQWSGGRVR